MSPLRERHLHCLAWLLLTCGHATAAPEVWVPHKRSDTNSGERGAKRAAALTSTAAGGNKPAARTI